LICGIEYFNATANVDVIILTRGGGSQEDLFCFNDEALARAVFKSRIPIVSAVGHEIDFTMADFVADLRAPTPSAAAEIVVPNKEELNSYLSSLQKRLELHTVNSLNTARQYLSRLVLQMKSLHPERIMMDYRQRYDFAAMQLGNSKLLLRQPRHSLELQKHRLAAIKDLKLGSKLHTGRLSLSNLETTLHKIAQVTLNDRKNNLKSLSRIMASISPQGVMQRGWTMATLNGRLVRRIVDLSPGDCLQIHFQDGKADTQVKELHPEPHS
jgi:exodeoxyribonuclease VII large subunit